MSDSRQLESYGEAALRAARIRVEAKRQIDAEDFAARVAAEKARIREHRPFLHRLFP